MSSDRPPTKLTGDAALRPSFVRLGVLAFLGLAASSAYLTRYCIAVANTSIQNDLSLSVEQMGWVMGAFSAGYFICQIPGGWLGNKIGTRAAFPLISTLWSIFTIWSSAVLSYVPLLASRFVFGLAQAGLVPMSAKIINDWFPVSRRGICSAIVGAAMSVGGVITMGLTAFLLADFHWRIVFRMYSVVGIVWAIAFYVYFRTRPEDHPWVNDTEIDVIRGQDAYDKLTRHADRADSMSPSRDSDTGSPYQYFDADDSQRREAEKLTPTEEPAAVSTVDLLIRMVCSRTIWGINIQSFFRAAGYGLFVTWFPAFLEYRYAMSNSEAGNMTMFPLAAVIVGAMIGGVVVDFLLNETHSKWISRTGVALVALGICGLLTLSSSLATTPKVFVALMSLGALFSGLASPPAWAATMDVSGHYTAVVVGAMNMAGTVGGFAMPVVLGYLIGDIKNTGGDWNLVIYFVSAIYIAGSISWLAVDPNHSPTER